MSEENTPQQTEGKHKSRDTLLIAGAFLLMLVAIFTIWQFLLKGKSEEERSLLKDTVLPVKQDTVKLKDTIENNKTRSTQTDKSSNIEQQPDTSKTKK